MYFSTNVMFRTLHSNSTICLSTWLPSGDVRVHIDQSRALAVGVGGVMAVREKKKCNQTSTHTYAVCEFAHILPVCMYYNLHIHANTFVIQWENTVF